jgi:membrane protease subunit HflK
MSFQDHHKKIFHGLDRIVLSALCVLLLVYVASGIFVVQAGEKAVLFCFGRAGDVIGPGIGYHWPWPVERVRKVNVKQVQRIEAYCITGDKNIIHDRYVIQFRIGDPANFLCSAARVRQILEELAQATILEAVASRKVDPILTTGKGEMERAIMEGLTQKLEALDLKIQIVGVERQSAEPPSLVKDAFQDVINAQEEMRARIHEAQNYQNQEIPRAKGQADKMLQEAKAYQFEQTSSAKGESERFTKLHDEYRQAPRVTRNRLFIEMAEQVLPRTRIMVLATDRQGNPLRIKILQAPVPTLPRLPEQAR